MISLKGISKTCHPERSEGSAFHKEQEADSSASGLRMTILGEARQMIFYYKEVK
jgi:hypothetical protein